MKLLFFFSESKVSVSVSIFETDDGLSLSLKVLDQKTKVSVSVSIFETDVGLSLSLNFWDQRQKSQYQSQFLRPISQSLSLSLKIWYQWMKVSVSVL